MMARSKTHQAAADNSGQYREQNHRQNLVPQVTLPTNRNWHKGPLTLNEDAGAAYILVGNARPRSTARMRQPTV